MSSSSRKVEDVISDDDDRGSGGSVDADENTYYTSDEFESNSNRHGVLLTSRLRRKRISRSKGGAFGDQKKKKRLYINAYSSEIDIQSLSENIGNLDEKWYSICLADVLYLSLTPRTASVSPAISTTEQVFDYNSQEVFIFEFGAVIAWGFSLNSLNLKNILKMIQKSPRKEPLTIVEDEMGYIIASSIPTRSLSTGSFSSPASSPMCPSSSASSSPPSTQQEQGTSLPKEVSILDEVITLSKTSTMNIRLSVSYAVAQSIIVSAFEDAVANKGQEYRYIPTVLAKEGRIKLRPSRLTAMIGDLFVLKHNINLHSDILDTPDFFWDAEDASVCVYEHICRYLELSFRVEVLNRRLDMMRDMLEVVQAQQQSQYMTKLDWIIIWLLLLEVVVQVAGGGLMLLLKK